MEDRITRNISTGHFLQTRLRFINNISYSLTFTTLGLSSLNALASCAGNDESKAESQVLKIGLKLNRKQLLIT